MKPLDPGPLIKTYRRLVSPFIHALAPGAGCRFEPSCSAYFEDAIRIHGWGKGSFMGIKRIVRCQPGSKGGDDPVPPVSGGLGRKTKVYKKEL